MKNMFDSNQCTICWHVDDITILHVIPKVVDGVISHLTTQYGKVSKLTVRQRRVHDYLCMRLDYSTKIKVRITMPEHIKGILEAATEDMNGTAKNPSSNHFFKVREDGGTLTHVQADLLRTIVAKILFVSCWSRPKLNTALAFLTMRFLNPDEYNYKKLACTIWYIRATQGIELTLEVESMDAIWWWINVEYSMHPYLKGHSGGMISFGKGAAARKLSNHRINSRISTGSEFVVVGNHMPGII